VNDRFPSFGFGTVLPVSLALALWLYSPGSRAATVPAGFEDVAVQSVGSPTAMAFAPDGRIFVCQQEGKLRVVKNGTLLASSFYSVSVAVDGERGLLGVAFDPDFANNGFIYIYYTTSSNPHNRISRIRASATNPDVAESNSEVLMLDVASATGYHNGGAMAFGLEGMLYVGVGEAHTSANSQNLGVLEGKMLRLDVARYPQVIPSDNPFVGVSGARGEIWALGLRNPFTFAVDPVSGKIHINDVGQSTREEINLGQAGKNFGWPTCEGTCSNPSFTNPIHTYGRSDGACIAGGAFYRANQFPSTYDGAYFFADYSSSWIRVLKPDNTWTGFATGAGSPIDLDVGPDGSLYYLARSAGLRRIRYVGTSNRNPSAVLSASPSNGVAPLNVSFSAQGSSDPDGDSLTYVWNFGDGATATGLSVSHTYAATGNYLARVTASDGRGGQGSNSVVIRLGSVPTAVIATPAAGALFSAGETINFSGTGSDSGDGTLPARAFTWTVLLHHDVHTHPAFGPYRGVRNGSFTIPTTGETSDNIKFVIYLTVTNSTGGTYSTTREVLPRKATVTLATVPVGLRLTLDGQPVVAPYTFTGVVGMERELGTTSNQLAGASTYQFFSWSDGGAYIHRIATPPTNTSFTASFRLLSRPSAPASLRVVAP